MPYIRSVAPDETALTAPGKAQYTHPVVGRKASAIPVAFQVTSPYNPQVSLLPHALIMHVNPTSFNETFNKKVERIQTRGGFVEQHWGDDLGEIACDASTGAFINIHTGLSSVVRQRTIAWDRYRDLYDLYRNNGSVYDPYGAIVLQGNILLMYDRGTYVGSFRSFSVEETDDSPFVFKLSFNFKVEKTLYQVPSNALPLDFRAPTFQSQNSKAGLSADVSSLPRGMTLAESIRKAKQDAENDLLRKEVDDRYNEIEAAEFDRSIGLG